MKPAGEDEEQPVATLLLQRWRTVAIWSTAIAAVVIAGRFSPILGSVDWLTRQGVRLANDLFENYGYLTVFFAPLLENTIFIGAVIPGTLVMLLAGLSVHDGLISFWPAILLAIIGAMIGDTISYGMGRFGWQRLGPKSRLVRWAEEMREPLLGHSIWLVVSYHFAGYSRLIGPAASGFLRMPLFRWMVLDYLGVSLWVVTFLGAGYLLGVFGLSLEESDRNVQVFEILLFAFFVISIAFILRRAGRARRKQTASRDAETARYGDGEALFDPAEVAPVDEAREQVR